MINITEDKLTKFRNNSKTDILIKKDVDEVINDTSWIDMIEESIPYLDNIIRNPRRFIMQEENIVPIAKAKVVTEESIKHLAQHTSLIQEVKEDGSIIPEKLLNVYREETIDLYENRFIKSLLDNLYNFVNNKLNESDQQSYAKVLNNVTYKGEFNKNKEKVKINVTLESSLNEEINDSKEHSLDERIKHIKDVLASFRSTAFIKSLKEASPVRSPIRKTNVILKEPNFIKALELWEYLEKNNIKPFTTRKKYTEELKDDKIKEDYDLSFLIMKEALNKTPALNNLENKEINQVIYNYVLNNDITEASLRKIILKEYKEAMNVKEKVIKDLHKEFKNIINNYNNIKKKALNMLK